MRWWLLLLAACNSSDSESCDPQLASQLTQHVGEIASGRELIGISWSEQIGENEPDNHAAIVSADGTLGAEIRISERHRGGTAGTTSVLWHARNERADCERIDPFDPVLQRTDGDAVHFDLAPSTIGRTATFDGQSYQLFWITTARTMHHVAISQDGTLGPVHDLGMAGDGIPCASAASDRAGTTFVRFNNEGFLVDPSTGSTQLVWTAPKFSESFNTSFYFAGEFHVIDFRWFSIDPVSKTSRERRYPDEMKFANEFYATETAVYGSLIRGMVALDTQLAPITTYPPSKPAFGTFGDDRVYFEQVGIDPSTLAPGHIDLSRDGATPWFHEVAVDSPVETIQNCTAF